MGIRGRAGSRQGSFQNLSILDLAIAKASNHRSMPATHWHAYLRAVRRLGELGVPPDLSQCFPDLDGSRDEDPRILGYLGRPLEDPRIRQLEAP